MGFVVVLIGVMAGVKKNIGISLNNPELIYVYYKSTTTKNNGQAYQEFKDADRKVKSDCYDEYMELIKQVKNLTNLSLLQLAQNNNNLNFKPEYNTEHYASYDNEMKNDNLVIEFVYRERTQNVKVYDGENARIIPYWCILFVIPLNPKFEEIVVYTSPTNDSTQKDEQYRNCTPFVLKGIPKNLISYVEKLK